MTLRLAAIFFAVFFLSACDNTNQSAEIGGGLDDETLQAATTPAAYYEYLWCKRGDNWTQETSMKFVADWNAEIEKLENIVEGAFGYQPRGETDDRFDGLWALRWTDKETMTAGWDEYEKAGINDRLQEKYPDHLTCGNTVGQDRHGFVTYQPLEAPEGFASELPYYLENNFCSYKEGRSIDDFRPFMLEQFIPYIQASKAQGLYQGYWFLVGVPDGVSPEPGDFNWIHFSASAEESARDNMIFENSKGGQELQAKMLEILDCSEPSKWDGYVIR